MESRTFWAEPDVRGRWDEIVQMLAPQSGERILDVGCGPGTPARYVATKVGREGRVVAVDTSRRVLTRLRAQADDQGIRNLPLVRSSAAILPFADGAFDAVICVNVLEAVPDKTAAIREIYRVLRPGGRAVIAHDDYESQVYTSTDRELGRRVTLAYASATFETQPTSDGQMGRHLWGLILKSDFTRSQFRVIPLVNTEYRPSLLGWTHAQFAAGFVSQVSDLTQDDLDRWRADLEDRSRRSEYLYCLNLYVCLGVK